MASRCANIAAMISSTSRPPRELTERERALLPSDDDVAFYQEHGYWISPVLFDSDYIDGIVEASERFYRGEFELMSQAFEGFDVDNRTDRALRKSDYSGFFNRDIHGLVTSPLIGAIAAKLAGAKEIRLWHDQLLYKEPQQEGRQANVGWHTDRGYWKTCTSTNMLTAWIPFHDSNETIGSITMIEGSHRWPDNTEHLNFFSNDLEGLEKKFDTGGQPIVKTPLIIPKGAMSFHHCLTIHGSGPNLSDRPRRSIAVHLQDETNCYSGLKRPNGDPYFHANDRLCRQDENGQPDYTDPAVCPTLWRE